MLDRTLPRQQTSPAVFLMSLAFINWIGFAGWMALFNNFVLERAGFGWFETGLTQTVREVPGFLSFTALLWFLWFREQTVAYASLLVLALGVALTGLFPTLTGILFTTCLMSIGFHYFETVNQSLQLQLLSKTEAPYVMGRIASAGAAAQFLAYGGLAAAWWAGFEAYSFIYLVLGLICLLLTLWSLTRFPKFDGPVPQRKSIIVRQRYWLFYALTFMSGARRQIFAAFGGFLLVKKFGLSLAEMALLMLVTAMLTTVLAARLGRLVADIGERRTMIFENIVLIVIFTGYALTQSVAVASGLFVIDGVFLTLVLAQRTYFQKIADAADMAASTSVAFTINHIAAVVIPVTFGLLGMGNPSLIFWLGAALAATSLALAVLVPAVPAPGHETVRLGAAPQTGT